MKTLLAFPIIAVLLWANPAFSQTETAGINKQAHLSGLIRTDREKRSWKTLKLWPGKPKFFYYEWVLEDGSTVTKIETHHRKDAPDRRAFEDRHPNGPFLKGAASITAGLVGNFLGNRL